MEYHYILFDLDGTLTESGPGIINGVSYALEKIGIAVDDKAELEKFIGPPFTDSLMTFYGVTEAEAEQGLSYYREYYADKGMFENTLYDGIEDALKALKSAGKILIMATSKPELYAKKIAERFGITKYFEEICGATFDGSRTAKKDVIKYALEKAGPDEKEYGQVLMIGDRRYDIIGAKENGIASMGVLYGYGDRRELEDAGADYIVMSPVEMVKKI